MSAPKLTPRERLVDHADDLAFERGPVDGFKAAVYNADRAKTRRLLRAHERDLFNRAVRGLAALRPTSKAALVGIVPNAEYEAIRAAILGPKRGRRA